MFSKFALLSALLGSAVAQQTTSTTTTSGSQDAGSGASATIFVPISIPVLLSPFIKSVSASVIGADACGATYELKITAPISLAATVTQGPSAYFASLSYAGPEVATCNFMGTTAATCELSGSIVRQTLQSTASFSGDKFSGQLYTVPITANAGALSMTSGSCTKSASPLPSTFASGSAGAQSSASSSSSSQGAAAAAPTALIKTVYKIAIVPAALVAGAALI